MQKKLVLPVMGFRAYKSLVLPGIATIGGDCSHMLIYNLGVAYLALQVPFCFFLTRLVPWEHGTFLRWNLTLAKKAKGLPQHRQP